MAFTPKKWWDGASGQLISGQTISDLEQRINAAIAALPTGGGGTGNVSSSSITSIVTSSDPNLTVPDGTLLLVQQPNYPTYFTNFSEYALNATPSDWTPRWITTAPYNVIASSDAGVTGGVVLSITAGQGRRGISWNAVDSDSLRADVEVVFKHRTPSANGTGWTNAMVRASGAGGAETGYVGGIGYASAGGQAFTNIFHLAAGASTEHHTNTTLPTNNWYVTRLRAVGNTIQARTWAYGSAEPTTWDNTEPSNLSDITAAGWVGLMTHGLTTSERKDYDWIGIATSGGTAPSGQ